MGIVTPFEGKLLRILQGFLGRATLSEIQPLIVRDEPRPPCLSRACLELVRDALSKGCVRALSVRGGWRPERFLREGQQVSGRLWDRTPPPELGLTFSLHTLDFLIWITATNPAVKSPPPWRTEESDLTAGDRLLLYLAYETLRPLVEIKPWLKTFDEHPLCRLAFPEDFAGAAPLASEVYEQLLRGPDAWILEALQRDLAERWRVVERSKQHIVRHDEMRALGQSQEQTLAEFLNAAAVAGRRDLTRFVVIAASRIFDFDPTPAAWTASLDLSRLRLADRAGVYRAATAFLRQLETLEHWQQQAREVTFYDEDYAASQLWKADWEQFDGDALCRRARAIVRALEPLPV